MTVKLKLYHWHWLGFPLLLSFLICDISYNYTTSVYSYLPSFATKEVIAVANHCIIPESWNTLLSDYVNSTMKIYEASVKGKQEEKYISTCAPIIRKELEIEYAQANHMCDFKKYVFPSLPMDAFVGPPWQPLKERKEKDKMCIGFVIMVFMDELQIQRLIQRLHHPNHVIIIQVSPSAKRKFLDDMIKIANQYDNVYVVNWGEMLYGSAGDVDINMAISNFLLNNWKDWDFLVFLGGSDYPLQGANKFMETLRNAGEKSWIPSFSEDSELPTRCATPHMALRRKMMLAGTEIKRSEEILITCALGADEYGTIPSPLGIRFKRDTWWLNSNSGDKTRTNRWCKSFGLNHGIYTRKSVEDMIQSESGKEAYAFFRLTAFAGDEHYWSSYLMSSNKWKDTLYVKDISYMSWWIGAASGRPQAIGNTVLTTKELDIVNRVLANGIPFIRKIQSFKPESAALRDYIDTLP